MFHTERIRICLITWPFLISNPLVLTKRPVKTLKLQNGSEKMSLYQSRFRQTSSTEHIFLCNSDPRHFVSSFDSTLEGLPTQSKAQMKLKFIEVETAIKIKLSSVLEQLNQRRCQTERVNDFEDNEYFNDTAGKKELSI